MLPHNIDLTENSKFSRDDSSRFAVVSGTHTFELVSIMRDSRNMSTNEYHILEAYEKIFGKPIESIADKIFHPEKYDIVWLADKERRRLGPFYQPEKIPRDRVPWRNIQSELSHDTRDILDLR